MPVETESAIIRSPATAFFRVFLVVFAIAFAIAAAITFLRPDLYAGTCEIRVEPELDQGGMIDGSPNAVATSYDPYFVQTTFEIIQSDLVLSNVVNRLDLNEKWGKTYWGGDVLTPAEAVKILRRRIEIKAIRSTRLIAITAYSKDRNEAAQIANAVAESYQDYRLAMRRQLTAGGLKALEQQFMDSGAEIQAAQSNVDQLRIQLHILDNDPNTESPAPTLGGGRINSYNLQVIEGERVYNQLQTQFDQLKLLNKARLREVLPAVVEDNMLADLTGKLVSDEREYASMTNQYEAGDEQLTRMQSEISELKGKIDDRMAGIMAGLESEVKSKKAALDSLTASVEQAKIRDQEEQERGQPYWEAKRKLARLQDFHKILAAKIEEEKLDLEIPKNSLVQIVDIAKPADRPVRPNRPLDLFIGAVISVLLGSLAGALGARRTAELNRRARATDTMG